jgi:uracil-DNA glycosylase
MHTSKDIGMFICCPFYETLIENYKIKMSDPSDYVKGIDNLDKVYNLYLKIHFEIKPISWIFNYCNNNESQLLDYNNKKILPKGTIGSPSAKYLFIGDRPNHNSIDVPFFAITGSSGYLNEALELAGIREKDLALSNAYGPNGMIHNPDEIIASLPNLEYIILMGNKAHDWFYKEVSYIKGKCRCIPHPSYLNRFHGHNPQVMADIIKGALND